VGTDIDIFEEEELRKEIIEELEFLSKLTVEEYTLYRKFLKVKRLYPTTDNPFFPDIRQYEELEATKGRIWVPNDPYDFMLLKPILVEIKDDWWKKERQNLAFISSSVGNPKIGRKVRYIIDDGVTNKHLGILEVGSDLLDLKGRDDYIGWSREVKTQGRMINHTIAGQSLVPTQPFGYNYLGGKLLALLCTSDKVVDNFSNRYGDLIVGITTTSLYGSFSQYNSLAYWNKRGHSAGSVKYFPSNELFDKCKAYLKHKHPEKYYEWFEAKSETKIVNKRDHRNRSMAQVYSDLKIPKELTEANHKRGIYFCPLYSNSNEFLRKEIGKEALVKRFDNGWDVLVNLWKERYAKPRVEKLLKDNKFSTDVLFYSDMIYSTWNEIKEKYIDGNS